MALNKTEFEIPKMDCPSEERIIRMALDKADTQQLNFDLPGRRLVVVHGGSSAEILSILEPLGFGAKILSSVGLVGNEAGTELGSVSTQDDAKESAVLKIVLGINAAMFFFEIALGIYAQSTGLIADSLDMFADAAVYGLSLYAVGRAQELKRKAARLSGFLQVALAIGALSEVIRRFIFESEPEGTIMMIVAAVALVANVACLLLLSRHRQGGVHMKASWIFSTNDVIANCGVILAGALVMFSGTKWPDLVVGTIIAAIVLIGGLRILRLSAKA